MAVTDRVVVRHEMPDGYTVYYEDEPHVYSEDAEQERRLPGVSSISAVFKAQEDYETLQDITAWWTRQGLDWREERRKAALRGSLVHQSLECLAAGQPIFWDPIPDEERGYHRALEDAWDELKFGTVLSEQVVASRSKRVAGTLDIYGECKHGLTLLDVKTSKHIGLDYHCQLAGYEALGRECGVLDAVDTKLVLQVDKKGRYRTIHGTMDVEGFDAALKVWNLASAAGKK